MQVTSIQYNLLNDKYMNIVITTQFKLMPRIYGLTNINLHNFDFFEFFSAKNNNNQSSKTKMGVTMCINSDQSFQSKFKSKYEFISQVNDHNFGDIKVYRKKQLNYDYVMVLYKYVQNSKLRELSKEIQCIHSAFLRKNQPMALRIFNFDIDQNQISNCSLSLVKIYVEYFNFTLHDLIDSHRQKKDGFTYDELRYILNSCVFAYQQFIDITQKNINISSKCIYLSPEGSIKFCPIRYQQFFQHSTPVCNAICNQNSYKEVVNLERGQKYLTGQVKKIFAEMSELNFKNNSEFDKIAALFSEIKKCVSIQSVIKKIGEPKVQNLNISSKTEGPTEQTSNKYSSVSNKPISSSSNISEIYKTNESQSVKLSLTKVVKTGSRESKNVKNNYQHYA